jgi:transposase
MAGKARPMSQIKQLLRLHQQQCGIKIITRRLGISKNTVKSYLSKLTQIPQPISELLTLDDPVLETRFHAGNPAYKDPRYEHMSNKLDYFASELKRVGVTRLLLWEEYIRAYPEGYSYSQFWFHLTQQLIARRPTMVLQHEPAGKLFIDFAGKQLQYTNQHTGQPVSCQVFVACLPFSDYAYAMVVPSQRLEDFLYALGCCLAHLGGVPKALVPDNLKSAVVKASRYEPGINRALEDFANHYNTVVVPARAGKLRDKALVENQVRNVYTRVFARLRHRHFFDMASLNQAIQELMNVHNQTRMQQKPYCRQERFLAAEKHLLDPLHEQPFELKHYREAKVAHNGHIYLGEDKHHYSVPFTFTGQQMKVIYTRSTVRIYAQGKQVATHIRSNRMGGYTTQ